MSYKYRKKNSYINLNLSKLIIKAYKEQQNSVCEAKNSNKKRTM